MTRDEAERIAIAALAHVASDENLLPRLLTVTGLDPSEIRSAAGEPHFLAGVLDFLLGHEPDTVEFARVAGIDPADVLKARAALGGDPAPWLST